MRNVFAQPGVFDRDHRTNKTMTSKLNLAQQLNNIVTQAELEAAQKKVVEIFDIMMKEKVRKLRCRGPFNTKLVHLLQQEGFVVESAEGRDDSCACDVEDKCTCVATWVIVSAPETE